MKRTVLVYGAGAVFPFQMHRLFFEARALKELGYDVTVAYWEVTEPLEDSSRDNTQVNLTPIPTYRKGDRRRSHSRIIDWLKFVKQAFDHIKKGGYDIVHIHHWDSLPVGLLCKVFLNKTLIYDAYELSIGYPLPFGLRQGVHVSEFLASRKADAIVFPSENRAKLFNRYYRSGAPYHIIPNAFPEDKESSGDDSQAHELLRLAKESRLKLVVSGVMSPERGILTILEALALAKNRERIALLLVGGGDAGFVEEINRRSDTLGLNQQVLYTGYVNHSTMMRYLELCDIGAVLISPTCLNNAFPAPTKLFKYMEAGIAVLASDCPDLRDMVVESGAGLVVNPDNRLEIAGALDFLVEHPNELENMKRSSRLKAEVCFSRERQVEAIGNLYSSVLAPKMWVANRQRA